MESLEDKFDLKVVTQVLAKLSNGNEGEVEELKLFLFGRKFKDGQCGLSILEQILMTPKATNLLKTIWKNFKLYRKEEILKLVSFCAYFIIEPININVL